MACKHLQCMDIRPSKVLKEKSTPGFNWFQKKEVLYRKKNWWKSKKKKISKLYIFFNVIFTKHYVLNSRHESANKWADDAIHAIPSKCVINFVHRYDENPLFHIWESKTCLISTMNKWKMFTLIYFNMGTCFACSSKKKKIKSLYTKYMYMEKVRRWYQLTHLHTHIDCSRNVSVKNTKLHNFISSLFLIPF